MPRPLLVESYVAERLLGSFGCFGCLGGELLLGDAGDLLRALLAQDAQHDEQDDREGEAQRRGRHEARKGGHFGSNTEDAREESQDVGARELPEVLRDADDGDGHRRALAGDELASLDHERREEAAKAQAEQDGTHEVAGNGEPLRQDEEACRHDEHGDRHVETAEPTLEDGTIQESADSRRAGDAGKDGAARCGVADAEAGNAQRHVREDAEDEGIHKECERDDDPDGSTELLVAGLDRQRLDIGLGEADGDDDDRNDADDVAEERIAPRQCGQEAADEHEGDAPHATGSGTETEHAVTRLACEQVGDERGRHGEDDATGDSEDGAACEDAIEAGERFGHEAADDARSGRADHGDPQDALLLHDALEHDDEQGAGDGEQRGDRLDELDVGRADHRVCCGDIGDCRRGERLRVLECQDAQNGDLDDEAEFTLRVFEVDHGVLFLLCETCYSI